MAITSPFKFLDAYTKEDKDIFFGRDEEVEQLYQLVFQSNLTLVYGQSGTGKTSLVQCGLANRFEAFDWFNIYIRRNENINGSLLRALQQYDLSDKSSTSLRARLRQKRTSGQMRSGRDEAQPASEIVKRLRSIYNRYLKPIYLIFDQFEELFILGHGPEQQEFYNNIADILETEAYCRVLIIMREESIAELYDFEKILPQIFDKRLRVEPMSRAKTRDVIIKTTSKFGIGLEDEAVSDQIIEALSQGQGRVELTYLQVFLDRLYQQAAENSQEPIVFSRSLVQQSGDIEDVLADFLDDQKRRIALEFLKKYPNAPEASISRVLNNFVTLEGTKRPLEKEQVTAPQLNKGQVEYILDRLEKARILRLDNDNYEVAHDALAQRIADSRSAEEVALLQIGKIVKDRYHVYATTNTLLNANEIQLVDGYRKRLEEEGILSPAEWAFVRKSSGAVRRRRLIMISIVTAIIAILAAFSIYSYNLASRNRTLAFEARDALLQAEEQQRANTLAQYQKYVETGRSLIERSQYQEAITALQTALEFRDSTEARQLIAQAASKSDISGQFNTLIQEGDDLSSRGDRFLATARSKYQEALNLGFDDVKAQSRLTGLQGKLQAAFDNFVDRGDRFFRAERFQLALDEYQEAAKIKSDSYVLQQIQQCRSKVN